MGRFNYEEEPLRDILFIDVKIFLCICRMCPERARSFDRLASSHVSFR